MTIKLKGKLKRIYCEPHVSFAAIYHRRQNYMSLHELHSIR